MPIYIQIQYTHAHYIYTCSKGFILICFKERPLTRSLAVMKRQVSSGQRYIRLTYIPQ